MATGARIPTTTGTAMRMITIMGTRTAMTTRTAMIDPALTLAQWFSPAYPVGSFAYSHGLESLQAEGAVLDGAALSDWIETVLSDGAGWNDVLFLVAAYRAEDPAKVDARARAFAASAERLTETLSQGAAFAEVTGVVWGGATTPATYPVAVGAAARAHDLPLALTAQMFLQAFAAMLAGAGMRLGIVGQTEGQRIIRAHTPLCAALADRALEADPEALSATAFAADIAAMRHETLTTRIFRT